MGITRSQVYDLFRSDDLIGLGMEADSVRHALHPEGVVTYSLDRVADFDLNDPISEAARGSLDDCISAIVSTGSSGVFLRFSHPVLSDEIEARIRAIRTSFAQISLTGILTPEYLNAEKALDRSIPDSVRRLRDAGLDSILCHPLTIAGGAESAAERRDAAAWMQIHRAAHQLGMRTVATVVVGAGESVKDRVAYLDAIRRLQEETAGFTAFVPYCTKLDRALDETTGIDYLKTLAISRLYLDNVEHIQATWAAQGLKVLQMGLRFGADDAGSVMSHEPGRAAATTEEELRRLIRDAGFQPVQRDAMYRTMYLN